MARANTPPYPSHDDRLTRAKTRPHAWHAGNPAGTKIVMRWFKSAHGFWPETPQVAREWYASLKGFSK